MSPDPHSAILLIGSNIDPVENIRKALIELCRFGIIHRISRVWQTPPYGSSGPDFINLSVEFITTLPLDELKNKAIAIIETSLGRQRTADKNAARTIDLDIILFDGKLLDQTIWTRAHAAVPIAELLPDMIDEAHSTRLADCAAALIAHHPLLERADVLPIYRK